MRQLRVKTEEEILETFDILSLYDLDDTDGTPGWNMSMKPFLGKPVGKTRPQCRCKNWVKIDIDGGDWSWDKRMLTDDSEITPTDNNWWY